MKSSLRFFAVAFCLAFGALSNHAALAQDAAASSSSASSSVSPADKVKYMKVRQQALDANPDLKTEQDALKQQGQALKGGSATADDKAAFMEKLKDHQEKMKAAMLKIDPTMGPLIDQVTAEMKQKFQQRAAGN
jgi:hypothetical protein